MSRRLAVLLSALVVLIVIVAIVLRPYWNDIAAGDVGKLLSKSQLAPAQLQVAGEKPFRKSEQSEFSPHPFDWPQWQGPERTAVSNETGLLPDWPKEGPPLVWTADFVGEGYSTPTVACGRVFLMGNRGMSEYVLALSETDGGLIWSATVGPIRAGGGGYGGPRCSPTVDGDSVYALGINGDLVCLKAESGIERWRKDLRKDFGGSIGGWGYSESPLIDGDKIVCTPGGKDATLVALNKHDGYMIWKWPSPVPGGEAAGFASMIAVEVNGAREYIQFISGGVIGVDRDGKYLWRYDAPSCGTANCSTPIFHDGAVFAASAYGRGGGLAKINVAEDKVTADQVYFTAHMKNHHGGMVLFEDHIYGADEALLTCLEWKTGKVKWSERKPGKGSITAADGRLYFRNEGEGGKPGPMLLVEANPEKYVEHGRFEQPDKSGSATWPHPVIANGKLYLRDQQFLFCYDVKKK
jgi:outer membrane protein assembly factor BamB